MSSWYCSESPIHRNDAQQVFFDAGPLIGKQRRCSMDFCRTAIIVFAISVASTNAYGLAAPDQKEVAYVGATVFDGIGAGGRPDMVIITRADRIAAILPGSEYRTKKSTEVVSLHGKAIIPGLINSH